MSLFYNPIQGIELAKMGLQMDPSALKWKGRIYAFDLNDPNGNVSEVAILGSFDEFDFRPHGISVWQDQSQSKKHSQNLYICTSHRIKSFILTTHYKTFQISFDPLKHTTVHHSDSITHRKN